MSELLPCPFCGSPATFNWDDDVAHEDEGVGRVRCSNRACHACSPPMDPESAGEWWNRRPEASLRGAEMIDRWELARAGDAKLSVIAGEPVKLAIEIDGQEIALTLGQWLHAGIEYRHRTAEQQEAPLPRMIWDPCSQGGLWKCDVCGDTYCSPPWSRDGAAADHRGQCKGAKK